MTERVAGRAGPGLVCPCVACLGAMLGLAATPLLADTDAVTVTAPRPMDTLRKDVDAFVSAAMTRPYGADDSLLRWDQPMCPLVAGMTRDAGEFVLSRLSQIARAAHAPLGAENCKPNLFVIASKSPEAFLRLWWRRNPRLFDTREGVEPVKRFIEKPRPVRVWYNASTIGAGTGIAFNDFFTGLLGMSMGPGAGAIDYPVFAGPSTVGSRLTHSVVRNISSAIVVIDPALANRLTLGQLTDYIGMVGLAQINLDKPLGEAPTILKAFDMPESPPAQMTEWDAALLKALYTTPQRSRIQLQQMETEMVKLIAVR